MPTSDRRELLFKAKLDDDVSRPLKRIGDQADDTADDLKKTNAGLEKLDEKSAEATKTVAKLRAEIAKTGDLELIKDLSKQEARLKQLARQRKLLLGDGQPHVDDDGDHVGERWAKRFLRGARREVANGAKQLREAISEGLNAAPLEVKAAVAGAVLAGAAVAAPTAAAVISGAVLAGLGGGAVAGGVAAAMQDPAVKGAAQSLGATIKDELSGIGDDFKEPVLAALQDIRRQVPGVGDDLKAALAPAASYVQPLERGLTGLVKNAIPGIAAGIKAAGPTIAVLERRLPAIGAAVSDMVESIAENADEAAAGFETILALVEGTVRVGGAVISWLTAAYDKVLAIQAAVGATGEKLVGWLPGGDVWSDFNKTTERLRETAKGAGETGKDAGQKMAEGWLAAARAAHDATAETESLFAMAERMSQQNMEAGRAQIALEEAIDQATASLKENGATLDINSEKGRANKEALYGIAESAINARNAIMAQTGSQQLANEAVDRGRANFIALADKMGLSAQKARELAAQLFGLPSPKVTVTANTSPALDSARSVVARINNMKARISVETAKAGTFGGPAHSGFGNSTGYSQGGIVHGPGTKGVDSRPALLAPGEVVWDTAAVDAAGGPAAVDRLRRQVKGGLHPPSSAGTATGAPSGYGGMAPLVLDARGANGLEQVFMAWLVQAIQRAGGNPQVLGIGGRW